MIKPIAVNNVIILEKDRSYLKDDPNLILDMNYKSENMNEIPEPYTGIIDTVGLDTCIYKPGQRIAFEDMGGVYLDFEDREYVVITPEMVIGILEDIDNG